MEMRKLVAAVSMAGLLGAANANGNEVCKSPVGVSFLPVRYLQTPGPDSDVWLFRLNLLAGCHRTMTGLDIGTVGNWATGDAGCSAMAISQTGTLTETPFCIRQLETSRIINEMTK